MSEINTISVEVAKLSLKSGDMLVIKCGKRISDETAKRIAAHFQPFLPEGVKAVVIDGDLSLAVLTPADAAGLAA